MNRKTTATASFDDGSFRPAAKRGRFGDYCTIVGTPVREEERASEEGESEQRAPSPPPPPPPPGREPKNNCIAITADDDIVVPNPHNDAQSRIVKAKAFAEQSNFRKWQKSKLRRPDDAATHAAAVVDPAASLRARTAARLARARAVAGPVPDPHLADVRAGIPLRDVSELDFRQLQRESKRLADRTKAVDERLALLRSQRLARRKRCREEGCERYAQKGGVCERHGAPVHRNGCRVEGCGRYAQKGGLCYGHGAEYIRCRVEGCTNKVQQGGVCCRHGASKFRKGNRCRVEGCRRKERDEGGGVCERHFQSETADRNSEEEEGEQALATYAGGM